MSWELWVRWSHLLNKNWEELIYECFLLIEECICISNSTAKDTTDDIASLCIARKLTVSDRECYCTEVVSDYTHCHICFLCSTVFLARETLNLLDDRLEYVCIIVRMLALKSTNKTLEAHTSIDYVHTKWLEVTVSLTLELHEYDVPYLDNLWIVLIDEFTSRNLCLLFWCTRVEVNFGARTTRTCIAHLPEVIVLVTIDDVVSRNVLEPVAISLLVACKTFAIVTFEDSNVEVSRIKLENINEILPCHINSTFLEVVTE